MNQSDHGFLEGGDAILVQVEMSTEPTCDLFIFFSSKDNLILFSFFDANRAFSFV